MYIELFHVLSMSIRKHRNSTIFDRKVLRSFDNGIVKKLRKLQNWTAKTCSCLELLFTLSLLQQAISPTNKSTRNPKFCMQFLCNMYATCMQLLCNKYATCVQFHTAHLLLNVLKVAGNENDAILCCDLKFYMLIN